MALAGAWTCGPSEHCLRQPRSPAGAPGLSTPRVHPKQSCHRCLGRRTLERPEEHSSWKPQTGHGPISKNSRAEGWALDCQTACDKAGRPAGHKMVTVCTVPFVSTQEVSNTDLWGQESGRW